jgi:hypothetical protein
MGWHVNGIFNIKSKIRLWGAGPATGNPSDYRDLSDQENRGGLSVRG